MSLELYLIGVIVAAVVVVASVRESLRGQDITRGMVAMLVSIILSSWFAILVLVADSIDDTEWGEKVIFKNKGNDNGDTSDGKKA